MQIVIDKFGTFIGKTENRFQIKTKDKKEEYSADKISQILITSPSSVSAGLSNLQNPNRRIKECNTQNI